MESVGLCTVPDDDKDYCKYFEVPKDWLLNWLKEASEPNEDSSLEYFLDNYTWDETWFIYIDALEVGKVLMEKAEA